ncbi:hypothetical protein Gohar_013309 [Gossypium harknessii]|uniref:AAA+ ATPase At3g28540-like C-terminal domain-containing protein n=1 Tax=Gossypium harknessii TaxID=34285 RepID=A0A7J9GZX2_9ROSI|nr:hypothetical protein [Gossypium harknessii]
MRSNVYDLQFQGVRNDYDLSRILTPTTNRSILLIEDIDCITTASHDRTKVIEKCEVEADEDENKRPFSINYGIIHSFLSLSCPAGFRKLAASYLGIKDDKLFACIDDVIKSIEATPAEVAQQLMISDEPKVALQGLIEFLNSKKKGIEEAAVEEKKTKFNAFWV